jgi:threonine dehydrogenase-like Zn-dependent dehydrogenase
VAGNAADGETHKACCWYGKHDVRVKDVPKPTITDQTDVLLKVTSTAICGSDLHMYAGFMPAMHKGDVIGHEFMGIIEEVGSEVKRFQKGDRVVAAFDIGCGACYFCKQQLCSSCDKTNPTWEMQKLYGDTTGGLFGYSHMTGGYNGGQAEYVRVPFGDTNLLKVPSDLQKWPDEKLLFLSDIYSTAWHGVSLANVKKDDVVAVWGCGPVGILIARLAQVRGAKRVIVIDNQEYRLKFLQEKVPGTEIINFKKDTDVVGKLKEMTEHGPDVAVEAVGFHYTKTWAHRLQVMLALESDSGDIINEIIQAVRKNGRVSLIGAYAGWINGFNIGGFMEKGLSMAGGQTPCQLYWDTLLDLIREGEIDPSIVITHILPLEEASKGYKIFDAKEDGCVKVVLKPGMKKEGG